MKISALYYVVCTPIEMVRKLSVYYLAQFFLLDTRLV